MRQSRPLRIPGAVAAVTPDDDPVARRRDVHATGICHACGGSWFWRSIHGPHVCECCYRPAGSWLVKVWIDDGIERPPTEKP